MQSAMQSAMLSQEGPRGSADKAMLHGEADADATEKEELESHEDRINDISGTPEGNLNVRRNLSVHRQLRSRSIVVANPYEHMWEMFENHPQYHVPWHSTETHVGPRWEKVARLKWVRAINQSALNLCPKRAEGLSTLQAARLLSMHKSSNPRVKKSSLLGYVPIGTHFHCEPGTEPFDTQSSASHSRVLGRGIVQFLATQGGTNPYMNPASSFQLRITSSGWIGPIERLVANVPFVSRSRGIQGSWFCFEFAVYVIPSHYSLRHGWTSSGSADGDEWHVLRQHEKDISLGAGGFSSATWEIKSGAAPVPCRFFKVQLTGLHAGTSRGDSSAVISENPAAVRRRNRCTADTAGGRHFIYCSGFELYGQVVAPPPGCTKVDTSNWAPW